MHELPALNYDLLPLVASFTESRRTLCAIMLTCHDAYRFCPRLVLQQEAGLHGNKSIHRFLRFMRAEDNSRWQYLGSLRFGKTEFCMEMAQRLAADLPRATNLERLVFDDAAVTLNTADPSLRLALVALPNVKDLVIPVGHHAAAFLETISWPLETAELLTDMHPEDDYWSQGPRELNYEWSAALLLKNACATLKSVTSHYGDDRAYVDFVLPVYPNVTRLVMTGHELDYPAAAAWSRTFPNVRHLEVSTSLEAMHEYWADGDIYDFARRRADYLAVMLRAGRWADLESYTGALPDLYASGVAGRIHKISAKPLKQKHWKLFAAVIAQARPRELKLEFMADVDYKKIPELLGSPGLEELVALTLPVHIQLDPEGAVNPGLSDFIFDLTSALRPLPLERLTLEIVITAKGSRSRAAGEAPSRPEDPTSLSPQQPLVISCDTADYNANIVALFFAVPALHHVVFGIKWCGGEVTLEADRPTDKISLS